MKAWHRKLLIDTAKAAIPFQGTLRRLKRRFSPYFPNPENTDGLVADGLEQIDMLRDAGIRIEGADVLEFGSGWLPVIPLLFRLAGAKSVTLTDQERLLDERLVGAAATIIEDRKAYIAVRLGEKNSEREITESMVAARTGGSIESQMSRCGFRYFVPFVPAWVPDRSIDIVISRAVLEHVPEPELHDFMRHFHRILKPQGAMCHTVDMSDHWEHRDKSIGRINFLRYSDPAWKLTCLNPQNFQNRLRRCDYVHGVERAGFQIIKLVGESDPQALADFDAMPIARKFSGLTREEAAILRCSIVGTPIAHL